MTCVTCGRPRKAGRKQCGKCYSAARYANPAHRAAAVAYTKNRRKIRRAWLDGLKKDQPCVRCGVALSPVYMHWHHRDPTKKEFNLAVAVVCGYPTARIQAEIEKCDLLCGECHLGLK